MLDIRFIRENTDVARTALKTRGTGDEARIDELLALDHERRALINKAEQLKNERNVASKQIGALKAKGENVDNKMALMKQVGEQIAELDHELARTEQNLNQILLHIPNFPHPTVTVGKSAADNPEIRRWGEKQRFDFQPRAHWEIGEKLGMLDFGRAAKLAGSGFLLFRGPGARLERALINFLLDLHTRNHGYLEVAPPLLA